MERSRIRGREVVRRTAAPVGSAAGSAPGPAAPVPMPRSSMVVGHAADPAERQADEAADLALRRLAGSDVDAGADVGHAHDGHDHEIHRSASGGAERAGSVAGPEGGALDPATGAAIERRRGAGRPLAGDTLRRMQTAFGADLTSVRVHDDATAATLSAGIGARAFTTGRDIFFGRGELAPGTPSGDRVLAHEVAHTLQAPAQQPVRRFWKRKKKISGPTGGHTMTQQEKGNVPSARELMTMKADEDERATYGDIDPTWAPQVKADPTLPQGVAAKGSLPAGTQLWEVETDGSLTEWGKVAKSAQIGATTPINGDPTRSSFVSGGTTYAVLNSAIVRAGYEVDDSPVFPKGFIPSAADVMQGGLGDCYLEAALAGLAATKPAAITEMIRDKGLTATVRLYKVDKTVPTAPVFTPTYVAIDKSRVRLGGRLSLDKGALWVGLVEKAFAAGGFGGNATKTAISMNAPTTTFDSIDGGQASFALEVLTGQASSTHTLSAGAGRESSSAVGLPWTDLERKEWATVAKKTGGSYTGLASLNALGGDTQKVDTWMNWLKQGGRNAITAVYNTRGFGTTYEDGSIRLEDLERCFAVNALDNAVAVPMLTYLETYFPGKRGTGKYSKAQLDSWDFLVDALGKKKVVTAASKKNAGRQSQGTGHSGGEALSKGLVGGHAYTVIGTKVDTAGRRFVQMRNPWGSYGREYDFDGTSGGPTATKVEDGDGVSFFELADVTKRFSKFDLL